MRRLWLRQVLSLVLAVLLPAVWVIADSSGAMMYANGAAIVNGIAANRTTALFPGDKVQTASKAAVTISTPGSTVTVTPNSSIVYEGRALEIGAGLVEVSTTRGMSAHTAGFTIAPAANQTAKFQVSNSGSKITVAALRGAVVLSDGDEKVVVQEGTSQTTDQANSPESKKNKKRTAGAIPPAAASQGAGGFSKTLLVGAAVAGVAVGTAAAIATTGPPVSPSRP